MNFVKGTLIALLAVGLLAGLALPASAQYAQQQAGAPVTQTGARGDAATRCDSATSGTQAVLTLQNPGPGLSTYVTLLGTWGLASGATSGASPTVTTATGIAGTSPSFVPLQLVYPAAGAQGSVAGGYYPMTTPIKGLTATAVVFTGPTAITNLTQFVEACSYVAP